VLQCIEILITDDNVSEPCERFFVAISSGISRVKTGNSTAIIINDDERE